jgi:hypothetical protein
MEIITERLDVDFSPLYSFNHDMVRSFLCRDMLHGIRKALHSKFTGADQARYLTRTLDLHRHTIMFN